MLKVFKPRKGLLVRVPKTMAIVPETGFVVDMDSRDAKYFRRRVKCGDGTFEDYQETSPSVVEDDDTNYKYSKRRK